MPKKVKFDPVLLCTIEFSVILNSSRNPFASMHSSITVLTESDMRFWNCLTHKKFILCVQARNTQKPAV